MRKHSGSVAAAATFTASISDPTGIVQVGLTSTTTADLKPGRYVYDVIVSDTAGEVTRVVEGSVFSSSRSYTLMPDNIKVRVGRQNAVKVVSSLAGNVGGSLAGLSDVDIVNPQNGMILVYNAATANLLLLLNAHGATQNLDINGGNF